MDTSERPTQEQLRELLNKQQSDETEFATKSEEVTNVQEVRPNVASRKRPPKIVDPDNFLWHLGEILERLHSHFYSQYDKMQQLSQTDASTTLAAADIPTPDLKELIPQMRQSVLKGTKILFTGVIPTNMPPERCPEWNTARAFGARIHDRFIPGLSSSDPKKVMRATTHVIAAKAGTSKLREARKLPGVKIVNPRWLWCCAERWKLVNEKRFPVQGEKSEAAVPANHETEKTQSQQKPRKKQVKLETKEDVTTQPEMQPEQAPISADNDDCIFYDVEPQPKAGVAAEKLRRHLSIETRLSVSEDELDRMEAEVDAELESTSSSSSSEEDDKIDVGSLVEKEKEEDTEPSCDQLSGQVLNEELPRVSGRKRKHFDTEESSSSNSPSSSPLVVESVNPSEDERSSSEEEESGDDLAVLLGGSDDNEAGTD